MKKKILSGKQIIASVLIAAMFFTSTSLESLAAENVQEVQTEETVEEMAEDKLYVIDRKDMIESENTENSTTYDAGDGVLVTEFYAQDVRFRNEEGKLVDYDASLTEVQKESSELGNNLDAYAYENKEGDKKNYFPENLTENTPVLMENTATSNATIPLSIRRILLC